MKIVIYSSYLFLILSMAGATILEKFRGSQYAASAVYGSWWFILLWALLVVASIAFIWHTHRPRRSLSFYLLHASMVMILCGALLTHFTAQRGMVHLRIHEETTQFLTPHGAHGPEVHALPFSLRLDTFRVTYHAGTSSPADYESVLTLTDPSGSLQASVSMNHILSHRSVRFYQSSYDDDALGSTLSVSTDPYGIPLTYLGYGVLFFSLLFMLVDPRGSYRRLLRHPQLRKGMLIVVFLMAAGSSMATPPTLPKEQARRFCQLDVLYGGRICPLQTFALDFTKKLTGHRTYKGLTAEQVLCGLMLWGEEWSNEPVIRIKSGTIRHRLGWPAQVTLNSLFRGQPSGFMESYALRPFVEAYYQGETDKLHREVLKIDERVMLLLELRHGRSLKIFPQTLEGSTTWYAPTDRLANDLPETDRLYMRNVFSLLLQEAQQQNWAQFDSIVTKMQHYQQLHAGQSLPSPLRQRAERMYNSFPFATVLFMFNLTLGLLLLGFTIYRLSQSSPTRSEKTARQVHRAALLMLTASFLGLTLALALRWTASGNVPLSNGYETMLSMAWFIMLFAFVAQRRFPIMLTFGLLLSGFFLLVSHISQMDPQISHLMPVLNSPLLSLHVSVIMMAYALLSFTFVCAIVALEVRGMGMVRRKKGSNPQGPEATLAETSLQLLSQLFLYPALSLLGIGIFVGAIWANVSWGTYWSWDPKETWALISFMVYAIAAHPTVVRFLRRPMAYHLFMLAAFLTLLMTYFGVNYFLGGMHSYA